jgi:hypothetical protein
MIASLTFFDPKLAERALLVLCASYKFLEHLVGQIRVLGALELFAAHTLMKIITASQTVPLLARGAIEIITILSFLIDEGILTIRSRTP